MRPLTNLLAFALTTHLASAALADGIEGVWSDEEGDARIEIARCEDAICGRIVWLREPTEPNGDPKRDSENPDLDLRSRRLLGLEILRGARGPNDSGEWRGGTVYDPANGRTYRCALRLAGESRLSLRGYVGIKLFGRTSHWTRVPPQKPEPAARLSAQPLRPGSRPNTRTGSQNQES